MNATIQSEKILQRDQLLARCMGNSALATRVVQSFLATLPAEASSLLQEIQTCDWSASTRRSHRLKGSAANVGALDLARIASELEMACREEGSDRIRCLVQELQASMDQLQSEVTAGLGF